MTQEPVPAVPMQLTYAPPQRSRTRIYWVLITGFITTLATLAGDYFLTVKGDFYIMGQYANYVIPIGAIGLGIAASSGYAIASLKMGVRVRHRLLWIILGLMLMGYFLARYVEFKAMGPRYIRTGTKIVTAADGSQVEYPTYEQLGFWHQFHLQATSFAWKEDSTTHKPGEPMGMAGYFFVLLAILGFCLSGLILPVGLSTRPYCELCERYMVTKKIALWPGSMPIKKFSKKQVELQQQYQQQHVEVFNQSMKKIERLSQCARVNDAEGFKTVIGEPTLSKRQVGKLPRRLAIKLVSCSSCKSGDLVTSTFTGQGKQVRETPMGRLQLSRDFVRALTEKDFVPAEPVEIEHPSTN